MVKADDVKEYIGIKQHILRGSPVYSKGHITQEISKFQKDYTHHYRVRCNNALYYQIFEEIRLQADAHTAAQAFSIVIERLSVESNKNRIDFSFASKMISTLYDDMPIWDSFISRKLRIPASPTDWPRNIRIEYTTQAYKKLCDFYTRLQHRKDIWIALINRFDNDVGEIPNIGIVSDYRKIDFVLWSDEKDKGDNTNSNSDIDTLIHDVLFENA